MLIKKVPGECYQHSPGRYDAPASPYVLRGYATCFKPSPGAHRTGAFVLSIIIAGTRPGTSNKGASAAPGAQGVSCGQPPLPGKREFAPYRTHGKKPHNRGHLSFLGRGNQYKCSLLVYHSKRSNFMLELQNDDIYELVIDNSYFIFIGNDSFNEEISYFRELGVQKSFSIITDSDSQCTKFGEILLSADTKSNKDAITHDILERIAKVDHIFIFSDMSTDEVAKETVNICELSK